MAYQFSDFDPETRLNLFHKVMDNNASSLGFTYDKKLSGKAKLIYSKAIDEEWRLGLEVDTLKLKLPVEEPRRREQTAEVYLPGPYMALWLSLNYIPSSSRRGEVKQTIQFEYFFPIAEGFYNPYYYFYSLIELEALINIYLLMYTLIGPELEAAIKLDIARAVG